jgi:hypothetical protein
MICRSMSTVSELMSSFKGNDLYFYSRGGDEPWCSESAKRELVFHCGGRRTTLDSSDSRSMEYLASSMHHFLDPSRVVVSWDSKDFFSFIRGRTEVAPEIDVPFYDLSIICSYLGVDAEMPYKFRDAVSLLRRLMSSPGWASFKDFYKSVYIPLVSKVIPDMETCCLVDNRRKMCVYPFYVPEGQANGRMKALTPCEMNYNPHSMGPDQRSNLRPAGYEECFVQFDYRNMEVNVLQWLSGDSRLGSVLNSEEDPYTAIWSIVTKMPANEKHRKICKEVFLPVAFGQGAKSLASRIGVEEKIAAKIIDSLVKTFPVAFDWVSSQSPDGDNIAEDFFGRRRRFDEREFYKVRNFSVQSPASMICLRKLVRLHESVSDMARICFHVHDGYCVVCDHDKVEAVFEHGIKALEEEDPIFPGLHLKASCHFGNRLDDLKPISPKE